jgi:ribosome-associated protein
MEGIALDSGLGAASIARVLAEHGGGDVVSLDVSVQAGWTDRFVIATATSGAHLRGLSRFAAEEASKIGLERRGREPAEDDEWMLLDLGTVVVHLMSERARSFYELEKLWFQSPAERFAPPGPASRQP